jgi:hypothetical protein
VGVEARHADARGGVTFARMPGQKTPSGEKVLVVTRPTPKDL